MSTNFSGYFEQSDISQQNLENNPDIYNEVSSNIPTQYNEQGPQTKSVAAIIGAVAAVVGAVITAVSTKKAQNTEIAANKEAADVAYERQLEFWKKQNEYNTPLAQRKRLEDAGLNPAFIMAQGVRNFSEGLPSVQKHDVPALTQLSIQRQQSMLALSQQFMDALRTRAEIKNINADTKNKEVDTDKKKEETIAQSNTNSLFEQYKKQLELSNSNLVETYEGKKLQNKIQSIELDIKDSTKRYDISTTVAEYNALIEDLKQKRFVNSLNELQRKSLSTKIIDMQADIALKAAQIRAIDKGIELTDSQIRELEEKIKAQILENTLNGRFSPTERQLDIWSKSKDITTVDFGLVKLPVGQVESIFSRALEDIGISQDFFKDIYNENSR